MEIYTIIRLLLASSIVVIICDYMYSNKKKFEIIKTELINLSYIVLLNGIFYLLTYLIPILNAHTYLFFILLLSYLGVLYFNYNKYSKNRTLIFFLSFIFAFAIFYFSEHFAYPLVSLGVNINLSSLIFTIFLYLISIIFVMDSLFRQIKYSPILYSNKTSIFIITSIVLWSVFITIFSYYGRKDSILINAIVVLSFYTPFFIYYVFTFLYLISQHQAKQWEEVASVDYLTGLKNRKAFVINCETKINCNDKFTLFYLDLDHFKSINDFYGHLVGDEYLIKFSEMIKKIVSDKGTCYRLAGDEFVIIYDKENYDDVAEVIMESKPNLPINVTYYGVSVGYVQFPNHAKTVDELLKGADKKLYERKNLDR